MRIKAAIIPVLLMVLTLSAYVQAEASPRAESPAPRAAVEGAESAIALLLSEEMEHEELVGLRVMASAVRPASIGGTFFDSQEFLDSHSHLTLEARNLLEAYKDAGGLTTSEVALIEFAAKDGLSVEELKSLKMVADIVWTEGRFNDTAKSVIPLRFNSMMVTVTVLDPESAPVEGALVSFNSERIGAYDQYTDANGEVTFDLEYSESDQRVDGSALQPETYSIQIAADSYGEYALLDWPWVRDQWYHKRTLTAEPQEEQYVFGATAREAIGDSHEVVGSSTGPDVSMCNGWSSQTDVPGADYMIVIGVTANRDDVNSGIVSLQSRAFQTYVKEVLPNEWIASWPAESLRAGGMAAKQYAWYRGLTEGHTWNGSCYDVKDSIAYQVWVKDSDMASTNAAVEYWWQYEWYRDRAWFITGYRSGSVNEACGARANGELLYQWGSKACADGGSLAIDIARTYYQSPGQRVEWHK